MVPDLAFHNHGPLSLRDANLVGDRLSSLLPRLIDFSVLGSKSAFASRKADVEINGLKLVALSHSPYHLARVGCQFPEIWVPLTGELVAYDGEAQHRHGGGLAYFCNSDRRDVETSTVSVIGFRFDMQRLNAVHRSMVGLRSARDVRPHTRTIELTANGVNLLPMIQNILRQVDALQGNSRVLGNLAIDDSIYRLLAVILEPDILKDAADPTGRSENSIKRISGLCEFLRATLAEPISLSDMEKLSGLSARSLQYAFQRAYGMTPKEWVKTQRLHAAHAILTRSRDYVKLTALAYDFCFPSPSAFSQAYQKQFGELPSETLARQRPRFPS